MSEQEAREWLSARTNEYASVLDYALDFEQVLSLILAFAAHQSAAKDEEIARLTRSAAAWEDTAAQHCRNEMFYHGLLVQIGEKFGPPAYTSDDGSVQQDVLTLRVPELVDYLRAKLIRVERETVERAAATVCFLCKQFGAPNVNGKHRLTYSGKDVWPAHVKLLGCKAAAIRALAPAEGKEAESPRVRCDMGHSFAAEWAGTTCNICDGIIGDKS